MLVTNVSHHHKRPMVDILDNQGRLPVVRPVQPIFRHLDINRIASDADAERTPARQRINQGRIEMRLATGVAHDQDIVLHASIQHGAVILETVIFHLQESPAQDIVQAGCQEQQDCAEQKDLGKEPFHQNWKYMKFTECPPNTNTRKRTQR